MAPTPILTIDIENWVQYADDIFDVSRRATNPNVTTPVASRNFDVSVSIGDIVAVNGQPAKGTVAVQSRTLRLNSSLNPGFAVADIGRGSFVDFTYEIFSSDGIPVGSIMTSGFGGGAAPPGAPLAVTNANTAIVGGTGAFLGARGQAGLAFSPETTIEARVASMTEDPVNRRTHGGGRMRYVLHLIPLSSPQIVVTSSGPAVFHEDQSPVTAAKPARAGETLITMVNGLGPTRPRVDPGQQFPLSAVVNSPVGVTVNGRPAGVVNAIGWPGLVDTYRVDFRVPDDIAAGTTGIQLTVAWIPGPVVSIPIQ